mgnify:CR=1 FL=1
MEETIYVANLNAVIRFLTQSTCCSFDEVDSIDDDLIYEELGLDELAAPTKEDEESWGKDAPPPSGDFSAALLSWNGGGEHRAKTIIGPSSFHVSWSVGFAALEK